MGAHSSAYYYKPHFTVIPAKIPSNPTKCTNTFRPREWTEGMGAISNTFAYSRQKSRRCSNNHYVCRKIIRTAEHHFCHMPILCHVAPETVIQKSRFHFNLVEERHISHSFIAAPKHSNCYFVIASFIIHKYCCKQGGFPSLIGWTGVCAYFEIIFMKTGFSPLWSLLDDGISSQIMTQTEVCQPCTPTIINWKIASPIIISVYASENMLNILSTDVNLLIIISIPENGQKPSSLQVDSHTHMLLFRICKNIPTLFIRLTLAILIAFAQ